MKSLSIEDILDGMRALISRYKGDEQELLEELLNEAEGWEMRYEELVHGRPELEDDDDQYLEDEKAQLSWTEKQGLLVLMDVNYD